MWRWAERYRRLGKDVTAKPGRYTVANAPFQREPQESFLDESVQVTVLWWASRLGKTEMLNNLDGYIIDNNPMGILVVYPTLDSAKKWSKEFFTPMIRSTPKLRGKIRETRSRDANNTILAKQFPGGKIAAIGANSPSGFRQIQAPVVQCDEIDAMDNSAEGDPITLAFKRADNYPDSIQVLSSTGTIKGMSRIESWYDKSDKRQWFCPCPKCGKHQVLKWSQVRWQENQPESARYVCEHCQSELDDDQRLAMVRAGEWRSTSPFSGIRGYWLNGLNTTFPPKKGYKSKLHQMVAEFLDAKNHSRESLMVWVNTFLAETWEDDVDKVEPDPLMQRREDYGGEIPADVLFLTAGVDVQDDRIEAECVGWGLGEESWGIETQVFLGAPAEPAVWVELDAWLQKTWRHPCGAELRIRVACVDTGAHTKRAYDFCRTRYTRGVYAIKGYPGDGAALVTWSKNSKVERVRLFRVATNTAKELIFSRLKIEEPGPGYCHFPRTYGEEYFKQLTAEVPVTRIHKGQRMKEWKRIRPRNEALDMRVYATAAFSLRPTNVNLNRLAEELAIRETKAEAPAPETVTEKPQVPINRVTGLRRRSGFVKGWM